MMPIVVLWQEPDDCRAFHNPVAAIVTRDLHAEDCRWLPHWLVEVWLARDEAVAKFCTCPASQKNHCYHQDIAKNTRAISTICLQLPRNSVRYNFRQTQVGHGIPLVVMVVVHI